MREPVTYENWETISDTFSVHDGSKGAQSVLKWAYKKYREENIIYASSFGAEGIVLIDLIRKVKPNAHIIFLDTDLHFPETYDVIKRIEKKFPSLKIEKKKPALSLDEQSTQFGSALWKRDPNQCCHFRKVIPLRDTLITKDAWISGLRREQSPTRANINFINKDDKFQNIKICPLIHWTWEDVWTYIRDNDLPYNELHDQGYPSIGCFPCTQAANGETRTGRWPGISKTECGLHTS